MGFMYFICCGSESEMACLKNSGVTIPSNRFRQLSVPPWKGIVPPFFNTWREYGVVEEDNVRWDGIYDITITTTTTGSKMYFDPVPVHTILYQFYFLRINVMPEREKEIFRYGLG